MCRPHHTRFEFKDCGVLSVSEKPSSMVRQSRTGRPLIFDSKTANGSIFALFFAPKPPTKDYEIYRFSGKQ